MKLCNRRFCSTHAREFERILAERNYEALLRVFRENGIEREPKLYDHFGDKGSRVYELECSVPGCRDKGMLAGGISKGDGLALWLVICGSHYGLHERWTAEHLGLGERLLFEWTCAVKRQRCSRQRKKTPSPKGAGRNAEGLKAQTLIKQEMRKHTKDYPGVRKRYSFILKHFVFPRCIPNYYNLDHESQKYEEKKLKKLLRYWHLGPPREGTSIPAYLS